MLFNSFIFFIFLGIVLPTYYLVPKKVKNYVLLISSYIFYGYWDYRFTALLAISTLVDYFVGQKIYKTTSQKLRKRFVSLSVIVNLGILGTFKYFNFFIDSFSELISPFGGNLDYLHLNIILPVGISFYTFQTLSYTIDIYRKKLEPTNNFIAFAVYVSFFPQLVAGPIERARNLLPQLINLPKPTRLQIEKGIVLIVTGLFKKVLIGDTSGRIVDHIFGQVDIYTSPELIAAIFLLAIQFYADFSGYSNIARGVARLLGIEIMRNFEQPFLSSNISEFWQRWHISLSSWLKDYLYFPLGGNRKGVSRMYINLMITMLLGGFWHGANWNYVLWGGFHGVYLAVHKIMLHGKKPRMKFRYNGPKSFVIYLVKVIATFSLFLIALLVFRVTDIETTILYVSKIINWESSELAFRFLKITFMFYLITITYDILEYYYDDHTFLMRIKKRSIRYGILTALMIIVFLFMYQSNPLPFVYFQF